MLIWSKRAEACRSKPVTARERFLRLLLLRLRDFGLEILGLVLLDERVNMDPFSVQQPITKALLTHPRVCHALAICGNRVRRQAPGYVAGGAWCSSRMTFSMVSSMLAWSAWMGVSRVCASLVGRG